ncbi:hypothetical protein FHG89_16905 [Micromonospora orduensis]|uniref:Uncharacterized protein n=1 Tax=Micromonospora orduensis TaxID=1420891 RepID=A0A5C4QLC4_9ACTN|nr:hypothetical protein FHG89_16905 [Micromonospora orduensis]
MSGSPPVRSPVGRPPSERRRSPAAWPAASGWRPGPGVPSRPAPWPPSRAGRGAPAAERNPVPRRSSGEDSRSPTGVSTRRRSAVDAATVASRGRTDSPPDRASI